MSDHDRQIEVVKWYTRARRFPQLIGRTPDGARIWGGPYTYTQFFEAVTVLVAGAKTVGMWGQFGVIGNALLLLGAAYGSTVVLGRLPVGSRNPLTVAAGVLRACSCPSAGRLAGRPVRLRRPHRARARVVINPPQPAEVVEPVAGPAGEASGSPSMPVPAPAGAGPTAGPVAPSAAGFTAVARVLASAPPRGQR